MSDSPDLDDARLRETDENILVSVLWEVRRRGGQLNLADSSHPVRLHATAQRVEDLEAEGIQEKYVDIAP